MRKLWARYRAWLERRERRRLEYWQCKRTVGKTKYILQVMLTFAGALLLYTAGWDYYFGTLRTDSLPYKIIFNLIGGYLLGLYC